MAPKKKGGSKKKEPAYETSSDVLGQFGLKVGRVCSNHRSSQADLLLLLPPQCAQTHAHAAAVQCTLTSIVHFCRSYMKLCVRH